MLLFHEIMEARELLKRGDIAGADERLLAFLENTSGLKTDDDVWHAARDIVRHKHVAQIVEATCQIAEEWKSGVYADSDEFTESVRDVCSVSNPVEALEILSVTEHDGRLGETAENANWDGRPPWDLLAQEARFQEVLSDLQNDHHIDPYEDPPTERVIRCETCDEWKPPAKMGATECKDCSDTET